MLQRKYESGLSGLGTEPMLLVRRIAYMIRKTHGPAACLGDLESDGIDGLLQAQGRYRAERGTSFATFAAYRIRGAMVDGLRARRRSRLVARAESIVDAVDTALTVEEQALRAEAHACLRRAVARLPLRERRFIYKVYFENKVIARAGAELGVSRSWASRLHARAVQRLRAELVELELRPS